MSDFNNKTIAITGAASGIGLALARQLLAQGAKVAASDVDESGLEALREYGAEQQLLLTVLDVADEQAMKEWASAINAHFGAVDGVINNAGVSLSSHAARQSRADMRWLFDINYWGVINGCEAFLPYLSQRESAWIVNLSSLFGLMSVPSQSAYNAAKFAVRGYSESLRQDLHDSAIHVLTVHPGGIRTNIVKNGRHFDSMVGEETDTAQTAAQFETVARTTAGQAAEQILRAMARRQRRLLIGADAKFLDIVQRLFPASYDLLLRPFVNRNARRHAKRQAKQA